MKKWILVSLLLSAFATHGIAADEPPTEWIDPDTGHRIVRLSKEPGTASLYFHQNAYSADGRKLIVSTPTGLATINLETRAIDKVVEGRVSVLVTGHKTGQIYYIKDGTIFATDLDTHATKEIAKVPTQFGPGAVTVNADETLLVCTGKDPEGKTVPRTSPSGGSGEQRLETRWAPGIPICIYTINIKSGEDRKIYTENDLTNHLQCSHTDPNLIMFCHEGPWHFNDRVWTIRTDGTGLRLMHQRTMDMEISGHEFFSADGKTVWYDLQTPRSTVFWLAGVNLENGERTWYHLERNEWSVHYNVSHDGKLFAGDGGGPASVANHLVDGTTLNPPGNGQWIYLFRPILNQKKTLPARNDLVKDRYFQSERLVNLAKHEYHLEPNLTFTPDDKWIVFRSNIFGPTHVFAVEIAKAK